jgi:hypothetical protein
LKVLYFSFKPIIFDAGCRKFPAQASTGSLFLVQQRWSVYNFVGTSHACALASLKQKRQVSREKLTRNNDFNRLHPEHGPHPGAVLQTRRGKEK